MSLTPRQDLFCSYVAEGASRALAARMAGFVPGTEPVGVDAVERRIDALKAERAAAHAAAYEQLVGWVEWMIERGMETGQLRYVNEGVRHMVRLRAMWNRAIPRLPPFAEHEDPEPVLDEATLAALREDLAEPPPAAPAQPAGKARTLNRHQRRALRRLRRK